MNNWRKRRVCDGYFVKNNTIIIVIVENHMSKECVKINSKFTFLTRLAATCVTNLTNLTRFAVY